MSELTLTITLLSDALVGSGEGFGAIIDTDIVYDSLGIPYIPARRVKGMLKDAAATTVNILTLSKLKKDIPDEIIQNLFGLPGSDGGVIEVSNLYPVNYPSLSQWLGYLSHKYPDKINKERVLNYYTSLRRQTAINPETGTAKEHSLRTQRVLNKGLQFTSTLKLHTDDCTSFEKILGLAMRSFTMIGTNRNRGLGKVECELLNGEENLFDKHVKEL